MKRRLFVVPVAAILAAGLIAAGCGDDDEADTSTTAATTAETGVTGTEGAALTEEEFVAEGNEICKAGDKEINAAGEAIFGEGSQPSEAEQIAFIEDTVLPSIQSQVDGISALTPPEELAADVEQVLADAQVVLDEATADPTLLLVEDGSPDDPFADINAQLDAIGLTECAGD